MSALSPFHKSQQRTLAISRSHHSFPRFPLLLLSPSFPSSPSPQRSLTTTTATAIELKSPALTVSVSRTSLELFCSLSSKSRLRSRPRSLLAPRSRSRSARRHGAHRTIRRMPATADHSPCCSTTPTPRCLPRPCSTRKATGSSSRQQRRSTGRTAESSSGSPLWMTSRSASGNSPTSEQHSSIYRHEKGRPSDLVDESVL